MSVSVQQVGTIAAECDPVLRNLQITVAYGRLGEGFARRVDAANVSWCAFGTWASEGVGGAIRHHQTDRSLVLRLLRRMAGRRYRAMAVRAAHAFAVGNRSVFDHIGRAFAGFHEALDDPAPGAVDRFLGGLPDAEVPPGRDGPVDFTPSIGLAQAFGHLHGLRTEHDDRRRAQLVAAANLCLAHVEQVRLQAPIVAAFGAILPRRWSSHPVAGAIASRLITEAVLELRLDDESFRPGRPRRFRHPPHLAALDEDLFAPFAELLAGPRRLRGPDADDWTSLRDRLRYIGALMRSRQQKTALIGRLPFSDEQVALIEAGTVPAELAPSEPTG